MKSVWGLSILSILLFGCVQNKSEHYTTQVLPPQNIQKSIQLSGKSEIKIQKESLGKFFLLRATIKDVSSSPAWEDLKPMVVIFERNGDQLAMFERDTFATYDVLDSNRLVSQFKITNETEKDISFEWGTGLKVVLRSFYDDAGPEDTEINNHRRGLSPSVDTIVSFVKFSSIENNELQIRQAARVRVSSLKEVESEDSSEKKQSLVTQERAIEVDYTIKPYIVNPRFQPKELDPLHRVGFFQTAVGQPGMSESKKIYASHWDLSDEAGPITFALTKHFPKEVAGAVKEGVLYWNHVLGSEKIKVIEGFDPEAKFPDRTVVVHWLPWEDAGAAWANFQADPLTGEIFRGQIYMTSVFLSLPLTYPNNENSSQELSLGGMSSSKTCVYPAHKLALSTVVPKGQRYLFAMDQLRHVVAHEVGHTMGLRHNFAGSFHSALTAEEINAEKKKYEADPKHMGAELTSSIMDYITGIEEGLIGRWLQTKPLKYDVFALNWVSSPNPEVDTKLSYCTDDDISAAMAAKKVLYGCERFDNPSNPFNVRHEEQQRIQKSIVQLKFDSLLDAMYPANSNEIRQLDVVLQEDFKKTTGAILLVGQRVLFSSALKSLDYIFQKTGGSTDMNTAHFKNEVGFMWDSEPVKLQDSLKVDLSQVGGVPALLKNILPLTSEGKYDSQFLLRQFNDLKASGKLSQGTTSAGRNYSLTEAQSAKLEKYLKKGIDSFEPIFFSFITKLKPYRDLEVKENDKTEKRSKTVFTDIGQNEWFPELQKILKALVLSEKEMKTDKAGDREISYPSSLASHTRKELAEMMSASAWSTNVTAVDNIQEAKGALLARFVSLYQQVDLSGLAEPPKSESAADHENYLASLLANQKIPQSIHTIVSEDVAVLKVLESLK